MISLHLNLLIQHLQVLALFLLKLVFHFDGFLFELGVQTFYLLFMLIKLLLIKQNILLINKHDIR
jgi:hypothetical protein